MEIILPIQMDLASKDKQFMELQQLIELKRKMLLEKQIKYKKIVKQNHFLEEIKNDYSNYSDYIMKQKQEQIKALEILNNYVKDLTISGNLSKQNIKDAKYEQKKIVKELCGDDIKVSNIIRILDGPDDLKLSDFPVANFVTTNTFFLGTSPVITPKQIIYICDVVEEFMRDKK